MPENDLDAILDVLSQSARLSDMRRRIALCRQALDLVQREQNPALWAAVQVELGHSLALDPLSERADNIERAIHHYEEALRVFTHEAFPQDWAATQNNLANAYQNRIRGKRADNLERAIHHYEEALNVLTHKAFPQDWATTQNNLAVAYRDRIRGEHADNIEHAIHYCEEALKVRTREAFPQDWATTQNNLANAYLDRIRGERADNLERAIEHCEEALKVFTREAFPQHWATTQNNLGLAYEARIRGERADNIECAIHCYEEALKVRTREAFPQDWATTQNNLAIVYRNRIRGDRADNIERAIHHYEEALKVRTREAFPQDWATTHNNLAVAYRDRIRGARADNIERAIHHCEQALKVRTHEAFPEDWAKTQNNLANAYCDRIRGERANNLERAIHHYEEALEVYSREAFPEDWAKTQYNLANAYRDRIRGERADNIGRAIHHYEEALKVFSREAFPSGYRTTQTNLGDLYFGRGDWELAHTAHAAVIEVGADLLAEAYTEAGRRAEVGETAGLYGNDAYTLLRLGRFAEGLLRLEQGKTRILSEVLALADLDLTGLPGADQEAMQSARRAVRNLEAEMRLPATTPARRSDRELADALHEARGSLRSCIEAIRATHPDFMPTGLDLPDLLSLIPEGGALVAPLFTSQGSAVFVVPDGTTTVVEDHVIALDPFTLSDLGALLQGPADEPGMSGWLAAYSNHRSDWRGWLTKIETTGQDLWHTVMGPVHHRLTEFGVGEGAPVLMMPQGGLGLLPLHAAWRAVDNGKRYLLDDYTLTYAPSGTALRISQRRLREPQRQHQSLLAVVNPTGDLAFTTAEGDAMAELFAPDTCRVLLQDQATREVVIQAASGRSYVHFASHGFYEWQDPMQSGLRLAGGKPLTLADVIASLDLSASRLVTLSACETGLTDIRQSPDEYLGLPAGFLEAGAPAVVSSLWPVADLSTMLLMERFYQGHVRDGLAPAPALRAAQRWLRDVTNEELSELFEIYRDTAPDRPRMAYEMANEHFTKYTFGDPEARPFAHPYYWAAFTVSGA